MNEPKWVVGSYVKGILHSDYVPVVEVIRDTTGKTGHRYRFPDGSILYEDELEGMDEFTKCEYPMGPEPAFNADPAYVRKLEKLLREFPASSIKECDEGYTEWLMEVSRTLREDTSLY